MHTSSKHRKSCAGCLWRWDLHDTGEFVCYRACSGKYHQLASGGCKLYERGYRPSHVPQKASKDQPSQD